MSEFSYTFDWNNRNFPILLIGIIEILDTESNYYKRSVSEMLHIKELQNGINAQTNTDLLEKSYFYILDILSKL